MKRLPPLDDCFLRWQVKEYTIEVWPLRSDTETVNRTCYVKALIGQTIIMDWNAGADPKSINDAINTMGLILDLYGHRNVMRPNKRKAWNDCVLFMDYIGKLVENKKPFEIEVSEEEFYKARQIVNSNISKRNIVISEQLLFMF